MGNLKLLREKLEQAHSILNELGIDCWLLLVRETAQMCDPSWRLVTPAGVVWTAALFIAHDCQKILICGEHDAETFRQSQLYTDVIGYIAGIRDALVDTLRKLNPQKIALSYSTDNDVADGLTHGLFLFLQQLLDGTPYGERIVSAEPIVNRVRGRKSKTEVKRIKTAIRTTERLFQETERELQVGRTERQISKYLHGRLAELQLGSAWDVDHCPIVNFGPESPLGHASPRALKLRHGQIAHIDFGIQQNGFCSDLQRVWYVRRAGEHRIPDDILRAFETVVRAIQTAAGALKPGAIGYEIDALARKVLTDEGYPEYRHALGHQLGRSAHDGGALLGPCWERYGQTPYQSVEPGNIFTLELGIQTDAGYIGLEEDVVVAQTGCEFLSRPQTKLWRV